jgi:hypothetical protein
VIGGRERSERGTLAGAAHDREKWAPVIRELAGAAVLEDPAWPGLAEAIARAHAAGWDVRQGIPRLVTQHEMPDRHPARELHYRLLSDCPAAMPTPPARIGASGALASRMPLHPARRSPLPAHVCLAVRDRPPAGPSRTGRTRAIPARCLGNRHARTGPDEARLRNHAGWPAGRDADARVPVRRPDVAIPVVELFLRD